MTLRFDTRLFTLAKDPEHPGGLSGRLLRRCRAARGGDCRRRFLGPVLRSLGGDPGGGRRGRRPQSRANRRAFAAWLRRQRQRWQASIDTTSLAWFQKAKLPQGAFSTLLYVRMSAGRRRHGPAASAAIGCRPSPLGDSCLFQVRGGELVRSFPLERSEQFDADPIVLGSIDLKRDHLLEFAFLDEMCYPGDELILCTDAVAEWAVRGYETGDPPVWSDFWQMSEDDWRSGVAWLRQERQMRIDDATMLMLRVVDEHAPLAAFRARRASTPVTVIGKWTLTNRRWRK